MAYESVDNLQKVLAKDVFHYAKDAKKAAGRALGTMVEIITFYCLKSWGFEHNVAIERPLPEFANPGITHNVEYTLHPIRSIIQAGFKRIDLPLTAKKISKNEVLLSLGIPCEALKRSSLLSKGLILRNSCTICNLDGAFLNAYLSDLGKDEGHFTVVSLSDRPFAIFECKRVGVEEGNKKGPQTIEKAKQGAYVARTVSSLQKIRFPDGRLGGLIHLRDGALRCEEYYSLLAEVISSHDPELLSQFILTVGVVSDHGNWFTSDNHNKEMKVLAQSYDWLLFLTDAGIGQFIHDLLLSPRREFECVRYAFLASYTGKKGVNQFTKVQIALAADLALKSYFANESNKIDGWFNIITPPGKTISVLREELQTLVKKQWLEIHK
jgi:hypothetical protein